MPDEPGNPVEAVSRSEDAFCEQLEYPNHSHRRDAILIK